MRLFQLSVAAFFVILIGYFVAAPYLTLGEIKAAIEKQDPVALRSHLDVSTLSINLKEQIHGVIMKNVTEKDKENVLTELTMNLASKKLVDRLLKPDTLSEVMAGKVQVGEVLDAVAAPDFVATIMAGKAPNLVKVNDKPTDMSKVISDAMDNASASFDGLNEFSADIKTSTGKDVRVIMTRKHRAEWKITNVVLPVKA